MNRTPSPSTILFTDTSHIRPGDLDWVDARGQSLPVAGPKGQPVSLRADDSAIARGIRLVTQKATKLDPLGKCDRAMDVIYDGGLYRSWRVVTEYRRGKNLGSYSVDCPSFVGIAYAESRDGFAWRERKPCPIDVPGQFGLDGGTVFIDVHGPSSERYKAVYCALPPRSEWPTLLAQYEQVPARHRDTRIIARRKPYCVYAAVSPDGLRWRAVPKPLMIHMSDTDTTVHYDEWLGRYVMFTRLYWGERRLIARAEAQDFWNWGPVSPFLWPTLDMTVTDDVYLNARTEYPGMPGTHLMFPMIYHRDTQRSDVRLYTSAEGLCWNQVPGGPVLEPGDPGSWDSEFILAGKNLVPLGKDRVAVPYAGTCYPHKYPRWKPVLDAMQRTWAVWPKGRLVAVTARGEGTFATFPLVPAGRRLRLNVRTKRAGEVRVGLIGVKGSGVSECDPVCGDGFAVPVRWKGKTNIRVRPNETITLQFKLREAELFGIEWV